MSLSNIFGFDIKLNAKQALSTLSTFGSLAGATGKKGASAFGKIFSEIRKTNQANVNLNKDLNRTSAIFKGMGGSGIKGFVAQSASVWALTNVLHGAIKSAMDMVETQNLFNVALGETAVETNNTIESMSELYGMDSTNLKNSVATYSLLARSMGMTADQAQGLGLNTSKLAYDLASLTNVPIQQVMSDLRSGLVGQSETVYKYGIDITEASIKAEAMAQGITKSVRNMSQGEKMALRYAVMLKQTSLAQGDFARTLDSPANQMKILSERVTTLTRSLGTAFLPMLGMILPYLNAFVSILIDVANAMARAFGYTPPDVKGLANNLGGVTDEADNASDAITGIGKAVKNATLGMDELNVLSKDTGGAKADTGAGGGSIIGDVKFPETAGWTDGINKTIQDIKTKMLPILQEVFLIVTSIGLAFLLWKVSSSVGQITGFFAKLVKFLPSLGLVILLAGGIYLAIKGFKGILEEAKPSLENFAMALGGILLIAGALFFMFGGTVALIALAIGAIALIGVYVYKYWDEIKAFTINTWNTIVEFFVGIWDSLKSWFQTGIDAIINVWNVGWNAVKNFVTVTIPKIISDIVDWFMSLPDKIFFALGYVIGTLIKWNVMMISWVIVNVPKIVQSIVDWFKALPQRIFDGIMLVIEFLTRWYLGIYSWITTNIPKIINSVVTFFTGLPLRVYTELMVVISKLTEWYNATINWIEVNIPLIIDSIANWFKSLPDKIWNIVTGLWSKFKDVGKYILDGIIAGLSGIGDALSGWSNSFLKGMKKALGIKSPSKLMEDEVGYYLGQGIIKGLENTTSGLINTAYKMSDDMSNAFNSNVQFGGNYNATMTTAFAGTDIAESVYGAVASAISNLDLSGQVIENVVNLDGQIIYANQQKIANSRGVNLGMGVFAR